MKLKITDPELADCIWIIEIVEGDSISLKLMLEDADVPVEEIGE